MNQEIAKLNFQISLQYFPTLETPGALVEVSYFHLYYL